MELQDFTINEALDKHFDFQYVEVSNPKVLSQYTFEHNGKTFALRHLIAPEMGKLVTKVQVGTLNGKKFGNKLIGITDFKMFFSTIANILLQSYLAPQSAKLAQKKYGIALVVPKKEFEKYEKLLTLTARRKLKNHFIPYFGTNEHPLASSFKVLYLVRKGKSFEQVFPDAHESLGASIDDSGDTASDAGFKDAPLDQNDIGDLVDDEEEVKPFAWDDSDITPAKEPENESLQGMRVNKQGKAMYVKPSPTINGTYDLYGISSGSDNVKQLTTAVDYSVIEDVTTPWEWESTIWLQDGYDQTPSVYYSVKNKPGIIHRYNGHNVMEADLEQIYADKAPKFKPCVPINTQNTYEQPTEVYLVVSGNGKIEDEYYNSSPGADSIVEISSTGKFAFKPKPSLLDVMKKEGTLPTGLNWGGDGGAPNPSSNDASEPATKMGLDEPAVPFSIDYSETPPKKLSSWKGYKEAIEKYDIRTVDNTPSGVSIEGVMTIDYEANFDEIYRKFDKIKSLTGADRNRVTRLINKYLMGRHDNSVRFINKLTEARKPLTDSERNIVSTYTGAGYKQINRQLREGDPSPNTEGFVKRFDKLFADKGIQLPKGMVIYRGQSNSDKEIQTFLEDGEVEFKAYVSCSMSPTIAGMFAGTSLNINELLSVADGIEWSASSEYEERKRYKVIMSISDLHKIPVFVPGNDSSHNTEAEVVVPRGTKLVLNGDLTEVHKRVMMGHFKVTGINGMSSVLESQTFKNFRMFCEEGEATERQAKEMFSILMMSDYVDDTDRSREEAENMYDFFVRMVSAG